MHGAAIALAHGAGSSAHIGAVAVNWVAVISVTLTSVVTILAIATIVAGLRRHQRRGDDDDADFPGGGGRGGPGPDVPRGPEGDPAWWPEFERQFAAHVTDVRRSTAMRV